ncbi:hypothetical protein HDU81_006750 [Chytriomyces hyalinus]|nr:hypothetical protein HDU81_006750 [Chytriomyces hyalinus]
MGIDLVFIYVFAGQIRAMQSDIAVNPALVIIARDTPGGVGHVVFAFLTQILVFLMCMACLVMKVKLVRLKDSDDVAYSGLQDEIRKVSFRNSKNVLKDRDFVIFMGKTRT